MYDVPWAAIASSPAFRYGVLSSLGPTFVNLYWTLINFIPGFALNV